VGGIKCIADAGSLDRIEKWLLTQKEYRIIEQSEHSGTYRARSLIIDIPWDRERACRNYTVNHAWKKYLNRGIPEMELKRAWTTSRQPGSEGMHRGHTHEL
jgi:hypothetical protein